MNVADLLDRAGRHYASESAIVFEGKATSYADLREAVQRVAAGLITAGVQPGERIALFLPNIPEFVVAYQACQRPGAVTVSINVMLTSEELRYLLEDSGATWVFITESLWLALEPSKARVHFRISDARFRPHLRANNNESQRIRPRSCTPRAPLDGRSAPY
jgi:acyl-CoA synthetase (AMP-forming)/AMP-acid ligase II